MNRRGSADRARLGRRLIAVSALVAVIASAVGLATGAVGLATGAGNDPQRASKKTAPAAPVIVSVVQGGRTLLRAPASRINRWSRARTGRWLEAVPAGREIRRGRATLERKTDRATLLARVRRAARGAGGEVTVPERTIASAFKLAVVKQVLRNNCESAALSMMLAAHGAGTPQLTLQRELPRSGPADPKPTGGLPIWGDPERGFVGRPEGGGTSGGYGVYEPPVVALARKHKVGLTRLGGSSRSVYRALLSGRPVMAWIGLSNGPFKTWRTPEGRRVTGNFGEHTVVLTGLTGDTLAVNDPLSGTRMTWSRSYFEQLWERLGRRAIA